jgi:ABC-2 type transport system ATP-binding protein
MDNGAMPPATDPLGTGPAIDVRDIAKSFRTGHLRAVYRPALKGLSFSIARGEIFGYLGPNGSGKTTTLKILVGLLFPDRGTATILGHPLASRAWRYKAGYQPEHPYFYDYLSAREYLDYCGRLFGMGAGERRSRIADLLRLVNLEPAANVPLRKFSKGMTQRVGLAQALINDPELVILDEPMSGLDPLGRRLVRRIIMDLKAAGKTVLFSTHILGDAESLCDRVALLRGGELLKVGALDQILTLDVSHLEVLVSGVDEAGLAGIPVRNRVRVGDRWTLEVDEGRLGEVIRAVEERRGRVLGVHPIRQSLEEYFVKEMGGTQPVEAWD